MVANNDRRQFITALASTASLGLVSGCAGSKLPEVEVRIGGESSETAVQTTTSTHQTSTEPQSNTKTSTETQTNTQNAPQEPTRITSYEGEDVRPSWSPDGRVIAYRRVKSDPGPTGGAADIGRIDPDGGTEEVWIEGPASGYGVGGPSPLHWLGGTERLLAYEAVGGHEVMEIDTTRAPFTRTASSGNDEAFTRKMFVPGGGGAVIHSVSLDVSTIMWLSRNPHGTFTTRIAAYSSLDGQATDTHGRVLFGPSNSATDRGAALVFDGSAFVISRPSGEGFDLYLHGTKDGEEIARLTTTGETDGVLNIEPAVSFTGEYVAFASGMSPQDSFSLHTIDSSGTQAPQTIVSGGINAHRPNWSPDGDALVFQGRHPTSSDSDWNLYVIQLS